MAFFDRNNFLYQRGNLNQLKGLEAEKQYYTEQIALNQTNLNELLTNQETLEKFAREQYLMKKENEEIFVIIEKKKPIVKSFWQKIKERFSTLI